jgi:pantetheine-phosphate adenylyltransferase
MTRSAFYPGSFDPLTLGHMDVIRRAGECVDHLIIGIGVHAGKTPLFSAEERATLVREACADVKFSIEIITFDCLTIEAAKRYGAFLLIRGLRDEMDASDEMRLSGMNSVLAPDIQTILLPAAPQFRAISATLVRQIAAMQGDVSAFVPPCVAKALAQKI